MQKSKLVKRRFKDNDGQIKFQELFCLGRTYAGVIALTKANIPLQKDNLSYSSCSALPFLSKDFLHRLYVSLVQVGLCSAYGINLIVREHAGIL